MRHTISAALAVIGVLFALPSESWAQAPRRIALSFDDAPRPADAYFSRRERSERIIAHLAGARATAAFFAVTGRLDQEGLSILRRYGEAGHVIANHTHSHRGVDDIGARAFLADVDRAHAILSVMPGFAPYLRFPYLNEGGASEVRDKIGAGLAARGYRAGYVTVDNYDWYLNSLANQAAQAGAAVDRAALGALYVEMLVDAVEHYDGIAQQYLGRSPAHVLLLHENDMAALYLGDLIAALRARGWEIVDIGEAYADSIAQAAPRTLFANQGRVAALARDAGAPRASLVSAGEEEAWIDERFRRITQAQGE